MDKKRQLARGAGHRPQKGAPALGERGARDPSKGKLPGFRAALQAGACPRFQVHCPKRKLRLRRQQLPENPLQLQHHTSGPHMPRVGPWRLIELCRVFHAERLVRAFTVEAGDEVIEAPTTKV